MSYGSNVSIFQVSIPSPLGNLTAMASHKGLLTLAFETDTSAYPYSKIFNRYPDSGTGDSGNHHRDGKSLSNKHFAGDSGVKIVKKTNEILDITRTWVKQYFSKKFIELNPPPLDLEATPFTLACWKALIKIPLGRLKTYGELAQKVGSPLASRAVGLALNQNPIGLIVPCHRVIGANGKLTGFRGGLERKEWLLKHEGVWGK